VQIAVLSGKGGTGKTTISTNLAKLMGGMYIDCDVEEPNGFIFLKPEVEETEDVFIPVPTIDKDKCIACKKCINACQFNALAFVNEVVLFEKLCHGCGACMLSCPTGAISEIERSIGKIHKGKSDNLECLMGILDIGEPMAGPIISQLKKKIDDEKITILDCAPGSSCNVVKGLYGSDYAILVTEPTKFGLHDLKIAVKLVRDMNIPFGIIINRADENKNLIEDYCEAENIKIIGKIPFSKKVAQLYSQGKLIVEDEEYKNVFKEIIKELEGVS
jgi:MinD superfamily P-loop ATPase